MHEQNKFKKERESVKKKNPTTVGAKEYNDSTEEFNRELPQLTLPSRRKQ